MVPWVAQTRGNLPEGREQGDRVGSGALLASDKPQLHHEVCISQAKKKGIQAEDNLLFFSQ